MIVKSATGDVDLGQPENIRAGMVFRGDTRDITAGKEVAPDFWESSDGVLFYPSRGWTFLGCDPAHATRADCERFGLAPGIDAGAHGFARTRDGFAVDLRRSVPVGTVYEDATGERHTRACNDPISAAARFIGLHADRARPEDIDRLCCGVRETADRWDPETGTYLPARWCRCTLAIGDHAEHEDIATGAKWAAESGPTWTPAATGYETTVRGYKVTVKPGSVEVFAKCAFCGDRVMPDLAGSCTMYHGQTPDGWRSGPLCSECDKGTSAGELAWRGDRLVRKGDPDTRIQQWVDAAERMAVRPVLRIYDAAGCVLAEGPMRVERTENGVRLHYDGQCIVTGTADFYDVTTSEMQIVAGLLNRGKRPLHMMQAFSSGLPLKITMNVPDATEEQLQALGVPGFNPPGTCHCLGCDEKIPHGTPHRCPSLDAECAAAAFCTFVANLKAWAASPAGQIAARDAAVARAIADVPEGCDGERWANVVRVIAADAAEGHENTDWWNTTAFYPAMWSPFMAAYVSERKAGYGCKMAAERVRDGSVYALRLFAAYEAGR